MSGIFISHRGTSSPEPSHTLARGGPGAPLRSRGSLAWLARSRTDSQAPPPLEVGPVMQARNPEHDTDQQEEQEDRHRDDLRREAQRRGERVGRSIPNDTVDMPVLAEPGANVPHESHEPG